MKHEKTDTALNADIKPAQSRSEQWIASNGATAQPGPEESSEYQRALNYLYEQINYEKNVQTKYTDQHYRLDRMRKLLERLGNPQDSYRIVHIAGTKGKGTVANLLAYSLRANGQKTGLYTSPHLQRLEERFNVDGQNASPSQLVSLVDHIRPFAEELGQTPLGEPTFFELTTAMGMLHFANQGCDTAVIEVGLGGRLDSTNVCSPAVSVITSISLDHQKILGDTVEQIAAEKAGIIKPGTPVVVSARNSDAQDVFVGKCDELDAPLQMIGRDFEASWRLKGDRTPTVHFEQIGGESESCWKNSDWDISLLGEHQADNVAATIATLSELQRQGVDIKPEATAPAIGRCRPAGRMQVIQDKPPIIIDTAHNPDSIRAGIEALDKHYPDRGRVVLFATSNDKDYRSMLADLAANSQELVVTQYQNSPRALKLASLQAVCDELRIECNVTAAQNPQEAFEVAKRLIDENALLYCAGSFFLAAELLDLISK